MSKIIGLFGYVQKGNKYFWKINNETEFNQGFKSKQECKEWLLIKSENIDWCDGFLIKFKGIKAQWQLVNSYGKQVQY